METWRGSCCVSVVMEAGGTGQPHKQLKMGKVRGASDRADQPAVECLGEAERRPGRRTFLGAVSGRQVGVGSQISARSEQTRHREAWLGLGLGLGRRDAGKVWRQRV